MSNEVQINNFLEQTKELPLNEKVVLVQNFLNSFGAKFSHFGTIDLPGMNIVMKTPRLFVDKDVREEIITFISLIEEYLNCEVVFVKEL